MRDRAGVIVRDLTTLSGISKEELINSFRVMLLSRRMDEKQEILLKQAKSFFHISGSGHEAAQIAAANALIPGYDWAFPYYRDQAFVLKYGVTPREIFLSVLHRADDPSSGGRQMPSHFGNKKLRIVSQSSPTGTQFLHAVGVALAIKKENLDEVVYVSSGEGATSEGEFFEAINWAARELLPVIFFIQDNRLAISVPVTEQTAGGSIFEATRGFKGLIRFSCDGSDLIETNTLMQKAVSYAREKKGPSLVHASVVRLMPHSSSDDHRKYRGKEELDQDKLRDPLPRLTKYLTEKQILSVDEIESIRKLVNDIVESAADWAERQKLPEPSTVMNNLYGNFHSNSRVDFSEPVHRGDRIVMVDAVNHALKEEMDINPRVVVFGQDVEDRKGGVFSATRGLLTKYGKERTFNSPLAEASIVGVAIGMAIKGWKPVPEIQFGDYIWPAFMQIRDELSMLRYRSNGSWNCPVVIRVPVGGYIHGGIYHSQCIESFMVHIPGIRLAFPSTAADAKGLLKSAIRGDDPVIFMEHKDLYRQSFASSPEPAADYLLPFGLAAIRRKGKDITIISYGVTVHKVMEIAGAMAEENIDLEVIDLRTLNPLDEDSIYSSIKKTNKVMILHEDTLTAGFGAEIAARITENCFESLDAPVHRIAALDVPVPYSPSLESNVLPGTEKIIAGIRQLHSY